MSNKVKPKRSYTAGAVPTTSDLDTHECAINWADSKLFVKNVAGQIVSVTLGGGEDAVLRSLFVPAAPTSVTATAGNAQATVSWTAPTGVIAQAPITDYVVQFSSNSGSTWTTFSDGTSTATSATVTGLTNGTAYTFRVAGVNAVGTGAYSTASAAVTAGVPNDALFSSVQLLLPMDGTGATFVDSSAVPKTITASGNATQSTAQSKWGVKSLALDGDGDYISIADSGNAFAFGTDDFCYEFWFRSSASNSYAALLTRPYNSPGGILMSLNGSSGNGAPEIYWREVENNLFLASDAGGFNDNNWHHYVFNRSGTTCRMFIDGVVRATRVSVSTSVASSQIVVGNDIAFGGRGLNGYIDDLRITKGHARYIANFTPPTAAFPTS